MPFFRVSLPKDPHQGQPPVGVRISCRGKDCEHYINHISICNTTSHKPVGREVPKGSQSIHFGAAITIHIKSKCNHHRYSPRYKVCFCNTDTHPYKQVHGQKYSQIQWPFLGGKEYPPQHLQYSQRGVLVFQEYFQTRGVWRHEAANGCILRSVIKFYGPVIYPDFTKYYLYYEKKITKISKYCPCHII